MTEEQEYEARSVLVVVAHPDDAEFMAAGTIAKWAAEGKEINYVLCTAGDKGTSDRAMSPGRWPRFGGASSGRPAIDSASRI